VPEATRNGVPPAFLSSSPSARIQPCGPRESQNHCHERGFVSYHSLVILSATDWSSYDGIANTYDTISVPHYFQPAAASLVEALEVSSSDRVLDLGAGTGVVAKVALQRAASVVAADISCSMLLRAKRRGVVQAVASASPALAFADRSFDGVAASFVLNHISDPDGCLREITRILRPGGRLGVTSWARGPSENEIGRSWSEIAEQFIDGSMLAEKTGQALPGEERLRAPRALRETLSVAGFSVLSLAEVEFPISIPTEDYLKSRSVAVTSRFMQSVLPLVQWSDFEARVGERLIARFGFRLDFSVRVNIAVAATPAPR